MSRKLSDLSARFRPLAVELIARIIEGGDMVMIVGTGRTPAEQEENIAKGVSWTRNSKHLTGDAIDLAPYDTYQLYGADKIRWSTNDGVWQRMGKIGEGLGLIWGGRWQQKDMGHFEYPTPPATPGSVQRRA